MSRLITRAYFIGLPFASYYNFIKIKRDYQIERDNTYAHHLWENNYLQNKNYPEIVSHQIASELMITRIKLGKKMINETLIYPKKCVDIIVCKVIEWVNPYIYLKDVEQITLEIKDDDK